LVQHDAAEGALRWVLIRGLIGFDAFGFEGEILLREIAKGHHDDRGKDLGDGGVQVELFDEELDENIIQSQADHDQQEIPEKLDAAKEGRLGKDDILIE